MDRLKSDLEASQGAQWLKKKKKICLPIHGDVGDVGSILSWEDPLEKEMATCYSYSCQDIPMDREAWWATVHGVAKESRMT